MRSSHPEVQAALANPAVDAMVRAVGLVPEGDCWILPGTLSEYDVQVRVMLSLQPF